MELHHYRRMLSLMIHDLIDKQKGQLQGNHKSSIAYLRPCWPCGHLVPPVRSAPPAQLATLDKFSGRSDETAQSQPTLTCFHAASMVSSVQGSPCLPGPGRPAHHLDQLDTTTPHNFRNGCPAALSTNHLRSGIRRDRELTRHCSLVRCAGPLISSAQQPRAADLVLFSPTFVKHGATIVSLFLCIAQP